MSGLSLRLVLFPRAFFPLFILTSPTFPVLSDLNADALNSARVLVGLLVCSADWTVNAGTVTVLREDWVAFSLVKDFNPLLAIHLASVLVCLAVTAANRTVILRARSAANLGPVLIHAGAIVGFLDISAF